MATYHEDGVSATVRSFLVIGRQKYRLAKTNGVTLTLDEDCVAAPGTMAEMQIIVDGDVRTKLVLLPDGIVPGHRKAAYQTAAPF
ncbi:MAG: hypothetical protein K1X74_01290 [Pirellulales bacterium]|nr:hypothetical protein [Pirellulales bacterium]